MTYIIVEEPVSKGVSCVTLANSLKKQYYCEKCNSAFSKLYYLRLHMKSHTFRCALCSRRYFYKSLLRKHMYTEHKISKVQEEEENFQCEKCSKIFLTKHEYKYHQWTDHLYKFPCLKMDCRMAFRTKKEYDHHKKKMHPEKFLCLKGSCQKVFKTKEEYNNHKKQPHLVKFQCSNNGYQTVFKSKEKYRKKQSHLFTYQCPKNGCQMVFKTKQEVDDHRKLSHIVKFECSMIGTQMNLRMKDRNDNQCQSLSSQMNLRMRDRYDNQCLEPNGVPKKKIPLDKFRCLKAGCQKRFKTKEEYDNHKKEHVERCKICGKRVVWNRLRQHLEVHLPKSFPCKICNKLFRSRHVVQKHMLIHLNIKQFSCKYCGKSFTQKGNLSIHERIHTGIRPYKCKMCSSSFSQKSHLTVHEWGVHAGKEDKKFPCDKCKYIAPYQVRLNRHKVICHQKIFQCEVCSAVLRSQKLLENHSWTHKDEKPFPCYYCDNSYATKSHFTKHLKTKHAGKKCTLV